MRVLVMAERLVRLGGMERYLELTLPALEAAGHAVRVLEGIWTPEHDEPDPRASRALRDAATAFSPDTIVVHNVLDAGALETARELAPRLVYHLHDHRPFCPNGDRVFPQGGAICTARMGAACAFNALARGCAYGPRPATLRLLGRRERVRDAIARSDAVVALSGYMASSAARNGIPKERTLVVAPPLDASAFADPIVPLPSRPAIAFAGRLVPQKGLMALVRAVARIAPERRPLLLVAGEGPDLAPAVVEAERSGVAFRALGARDPAGVRDLLDASSALAMPGTWAEPFGLAAIEAHARGRAVAAYATGGTGEWRCASDRFAPVGDVGALARAVEAVCLPADPQGAARDARAQAETYRPGPRAAELAAIYEGRPTAAV